MIYMDHHTHAGLSDMLNCVECRDIRIEALESKLSAAREALAQISSDSFYIESCGDDCVVKAQEIAAEALKVIGDT